jgi:transposase
MSKSQASVNLDADLSLRTERLGPLPVINHFLARLDLEGRLNHFVPTRDRRVRLPYAKGLGVLLRSILVEREPIYRQHEIVSTFADETFGLDAESVRYVNDDSIGRALDRLFDADRAALLTDVVVAATQEFDVALEELHNDSTTVKFCGRYTQARGRRLRGKRAPFITHGYSKDHRPDLKQLLFILTTSDDGGLPVQFRCEAGNYSDSRTHEESWDALCQATGRVDFLYVADSKLCNRDAMDHIDRHGGRLVTVLPRSRGEDPQFREWIQTHEPNWELVVDRPNPRQHDGPRDRWWVFRYPAPSREGWPIIWIYSSLLALSQEHRRQKRIARTIEELEALNARLAGPRPRRRSRKELQDSVTDILKACKTSRCLLVEVVQHQEHHFRQVGPGRPGPKTRYVRKTRKSWRLQWLVDEEMIAYDRKSDGMYPLLTNDRTLANAQVLQAHKRQPIVEKRFEQTKTVFEIAPAMLKNEGRVEALFFVYFLALLVQALIERELRRQMKRQDVEHLPLYPEERTTKHPTSEQIFRLFALMQRHVLQQDGQDVRTFEPELTDLQQQVLGLLGISEEAIYAS